MSSHEEHHSSSHGGPHSNDLMIFSKRLLGKLRSIPIAHWLGVDVQEGAVKRLGVVAGLTIPACAIPLLTVLLGQSLLVGDITSGFISLAIFGIKPR